MSLLNYFPWVALCTTCLMCSHALRPCMPSRFCFFRAFLFYLPYVPSFFTCLTYLNIFYLPYVPSFLGALRDFGFHVTYVPSFFTYFSYPHFLRALRALIFVRALLSFILLRVFSAVIFLRASRAFIILCVLRLHFLTCLHFIYGSKTIAPEKNCKIIKFALVYL